MPSKFLQKIISFRRDLHAHPELSEREQETAKAVVERLSGAGPSRILTGLGRMQTGVCAVYDSGSPGPVVLLRCELDALPIRERNEFHHRSQTAGVSHKCGHDGHMATLIAVAESLSRHPTGRGRVYLLFQPAEETGTGAQAVIGDPAFQALEPPDYVYAFHNVPRYPLGEVLLRTGLFAQASVGFFATFSGSTSHSSYPEHGLNPSPAVTKLIGEVNEIDRRYAGRTAAPVLGTVTYAEIGRAEHGPNFGISPGEARISGVLRAHEDRDLEQLRGNLAQRVAELATEWRLAHTIEWREAFAATVSDEPCNDVVRSAALELGLSVTDLDEPFRWSEDFGHFSRAFPGSFFGLGSGVDQPQLHDDSYDYPDELIGIGAELYRGIIDHHLAIAEE